MPLSNLALLVVTGLAKIQNLKANHNYKLNQLKISIVVTGLAKIQNLKANHNQSLHVLC